MKTYIENPNPQLYSLLKWLDRCTSTDPTRPTLQAINIKFNRFEATNGFMIGIAITEAPIKFYADLEDGKYIIESISKELIVMSPLEEGKYPDVNVIMNKLHIPEAHSLVCLDPKLFKKLTAGFERAHVNVHNDRAPIEIVLEGDNMPTGTYLAVLMPLATDRCNSESTMTKAFEKLVSDESNTVL
jgi:hypothetical protein